MKIKTLLFSMILYLPAFLLAQNTIHVPGDQPTIQAGIDAASDGDIVLVDEGIYYENIFFRGKAITVASLHWQDGLDSHIENTIIDGSKAGNPDSASVVYFFNMEDTLSVLHGFTIQGGKGTKEVNARMGGGIMCYYSGCKIVHNRIINNECTNDGKGAWGGGINIWSGYAKISVIRNNVISNNACFKKNPGTGEPIGGGISIGYWNSGSECLIEGNLIANNQCVDEIGDAYCIGAGIEVDVVKARIINNQIIGNVSSSVSSYWASWGAGIGGWKLQEGSTISGNMIAENTGYTGMLNLFYGGGIGIFENAGSVCIDGNIIKENLADAGGGIWINSSSEDVKITNNVLSGHTAPGWGGGGIFINEMVKKGKEDQIAARGATPGGETTSYTKGSGSHVVANNTFYRNAFPSYAGFAASIQLEYPTAPLIAFNNIFYSLEGGGGYEIWLGGSDSSFSAYLFNNMLDTINHINGNYPGRWVGENNIVCDPSFEDTLCHLTGNCCCINSGLESIEINGTIYYCPDHDIDGQSRPQNDGVDIGSDEKAWVGVEYPAIGSGQPVVSVYPNPTSGISSFGFQVPSCEHVTLKIYNIHGSEIATVVDREMPAGEHVVSFDMSQLTAGIYFGRLQTRDGMKTGKIIKQ